MPYRAAASPFGTCEQHAETPAMGLCARCGRRACEGCVIFEMVSMLCRSCSGSVARQAGRKRLTRVARASVFVLGMTAATWAVAASILSPEAECLTDRGVVDCAYVVRTSAATWLFGS
jgi:hypothetical protein